MSFSGIKMGRIPKAEKERAIKSLENQQNSPDQTRSHSTGYNNSANNRIYDSIGNATSEIEQDSSLSTNADSSMLTKRARLMKMQTSYKSLDEHSMSMSDSEQNATCKFSGNSNKNENFCINAMMSEHVNGLNEQNEMATNSEHHTKNNRSRLDNADAQLRNEFINKYKNKYR